MFENNHRVHGTIPAILLALFMALPAFPVAASDGASNGMTSGRSVTDDSNDLIVPSGESYVLFGCHTYTRSVQIDGTIIVKYNDGVDDSTGTLTLVAPVITVGPSGIIVADGRGYGGGGGGTELYTSFSQQQAGYGGTGGKGGNGAPGWGIYGSGGGGGSPGGLGGAAYSSTYSYPGKDANDTRGGDGGICTYDSPAKVGGVGGSGYGGGGGGGAGDDWHAGGGGGGGSGGNTGNSNTGGNGGGPYGGAGGIGSGNTIQPPPGTNGGYNATAANGDNSTDFCITKGSGGGGGGSSWDDYAGGGGGGAGGGCVALIASGDLAMNGNISTTGAGGGGGGQDHSGYGGAGGGGAGGGILLAGQKITLGSGANMDARGRDKNTLSVSNGGTVKMLYNDSLDLSSARIQAGRIYRNGPPKMQGLVSPENDATTMVRPVFQWNPAMDPDSNPLTYQLQVSKHADFRTRELDKTGLIATEYAMDKDLPRDIGYFWRVRAMDFIGYSNWTPVWKFAPDSVPPVSQVSPLPVFMNALNFTVSWNGTDDFTTITGIDVLVAVGNDSTDYLPWIENTCKTSALYRGVDGHKYSFFSVATDRNHNREADPGVADAFTTVDVSPPVTTMGALTTYQGSLIINLSWSATDAISGVKYYNVFVAQGDEDFQLWQEHTNRTKEQFDAEDGRDYKFYAIACDNVGNWEAMTPATKIQKTRVDLTPPVINLGLGAPSFGADPVFITPLTTIKIDSTDNFAGVNGTFFKIDEQGIRTYAALLRVSEAGSHNISYWATDKAGNKCTPAGLWFFVDTEPPATSLNCEGTYAITGGNIYVTAAASLVLTAADGASGLSWTEYSLDKRGYTRYTTPFKFTSGNHSLAYRSVDNVGNVEAEKSATIVVDTTPPTTRVEWDIVAVSNQDVELAFFSTDDASGVSGTFFRVLREREKGEDFQAGATVTVEAGSDGSNDANYTVQYYSVDLLNNTEKAKEIKFRMDTQVALQLRFTGEPSVSLNHYLLAGITEPRSKVTVGNAEVQPTSDGSFEKDIALKPGKNTVTITITDPTGNTLTRIVYVTYNEPISSTGWFLPLVVIVVIACAAGGGAFIFWRLKKGARKIPPRTPPAARPRPRAPPPVPPPTR